MLQSGLGARDHRTASGRNMEHWKFVWAGILGIATAMAPLASCTQRQIESAPDFGQQKKWQQKPDPDDDDDNDDSGGGQVPSLMEACARVLVPTGETNQWSQGVATNLSSGELVTAAHILMEQGGRLGRLDGMRIMRLGSWGNEVLARGGSINVNQYSDIAVIRPAERVALARLPVATRLPAPGDTVHVALLSSGRGEFASALLTGTVLGYSSDGQFFAVSGHAMQGDSGGPVVDGNGRFVGVVVGGPGEQGGQIGIPFDVDRRDGGFSTRWRGSVQTWNGPHVLCSVYRR